MAYIGRDIDKISNVEVLDNITFDGSSSYTLQKGGSNFTPSSANTLLVSIDGVVQAGNFTVSGSTINFGTAVSASSTCNFILHYGVGLITAPADGTVTTAKLADSSVSLAKLTATGTKDATTFLRGDNTFATPAGGTNTPAFMAKIGTNQSTANTVITKLQFSNEIYDSSGCYDNVTNYRFTPNVAGKYYVSLIARAEGLTTNTFNDVSAYIRKNGSNLFISTFGNYATFSFRNLSVSAYGIVDMNGTTDYLEAFADVFQNPTTTGQSYFQTPSVFLAYRIIE